MPTQATLSQEELASQYGFALSFMRQDKSLYALFQQAVKENMSTAKFTAKLRETPWYKKNGESVRQYQLLQSTDPATLGARRSQLLAQIQDMAGQMGAVIPAKNLTTIAESALKLNWNDSQLRNSLSGYVKAYNGVYTGAASTSVEDLRQTAWRNGVNLSSATLQSYAQAIAAGKVNVDYYKNLIRKQASSLAPGYADELANGMDLYDIGNSFIQSKAKILEMNPADIDLFDPDVRSALSGTTKDGKPSSTSLWQFEQQLRQKPEWLKTNNAQDQTMGVAHKVLMDMGLMG